MLKELLSLVATILTFAAFVPYISSILAGKTKPHVFSWVVWGVTTLVVFFAQLAGGGGVGAYAMGISALITFYVAYLAYRFQSDGSVTCSDWAFFVSSLLAIPVWYYTSDPLWAVVILTLVDTLGVWPTIRKAYVKPHEEQIALYAITTIRNLILIMSLEVYSLTTILFPAVMSAACIPLILIIYYRRDKVKEDSYIA